MSNKNLTKYSQIKHSFDQKASTYDDFNIIQKIASKAVVHDIVDKPKNILELGSGSGQIYSQIPWNLEYYKAVDMSKVMCYKHPKADNIDVVCANFDSYKFLETIIDERYDCVVSSSALQWSQNLDNILKTIKNISPRFVIAMFTANTFKTIFDITGNISPILTKNSIKQKFEKYLKCEFETHDYKLKFKQKKDLFGFIKNSGVSAGVRLSYKQAKNLWQKYDKDYLEFEVIYIKAEPKL